MDDNGQQQQQQQSQQDDNGADRPSFATFWQRSKDALTPRKITFVSSGSGSGSGIGAGTSGASTNADANAGAGEFGDLLLPNTFQFGYT